MRRAASSLAPAARPLPRAAGILGPVNSSLSPAAGPVTADDVQHAVAAAVDTLASATERDWHVPAAGLDWDCWETLEHLSDDLFSYAAQLGPRHPPLAGHIAFAWQPRRPGGPANAIFSDPGAGNAGLLGVVEACGGLLSAIVRVSPPELRAYHAFGVSDPAGFAAMGVIETLVHTYDVATALGLDWTPEPGLSGRVLARLFPDAPAGTDPWPTLLWATGRGEIAGRPRLESWRWDGTPRQPHRSAP